MSSWRLQGLDLKSLRKNPSLLPLFGCFFVGLIGSTGYLLRLAIKNPDVTWNSKKNPEPWQEYKDKEYKLWPSEEFKITPKSQIPEY